MVLRMDTMYVRVTGMGLRCIMSSCIIDAWWLILLAIKCRNMRLIRYAAACLSRKINTHFVLYFNAFFLLG